MQNSDESPYTKIKLIDRGGFGKINLVEDKSTGKKYALKVSKAK